MGIFEPNGSNSTRSKSACQEDIEPFGKKIKPVAQDGGNSTGPVSNPRTGTVPEYEAAPRPPQPPPTRELVESEVIPCDRCGTVVSMLILAPEATDPGRFEDHARKMYPEYTRLDVPTWNRPCTWRWPPGDRPADFLKVWPSRARVDRLRPADFNPNIERLATEHCR